MKSIAPRLAAASLVFRLAPMAAPMLALAAFLPARDAAAQDALPPLPPAPAQPATGEPPAPRAATAPAPSSPPPVVVVPPAPAEYPAPPEGAPSAPFANRGFQLHAGLGYTRPFGRVSDDDGAASGYSNGQLMLLDLGIGGKIGRFFYLGAYLTLAGGGSAASSCDKCSSGSAHFGLEAQYFFRPSEKWDPWIGYGIGVEGLSADTDRATVTFTGFEFARLTAGVDARLTKGFGVGPYIGFSFARYTDRDTQFNTVDVRSTIDNRTVHGWFTLGLRFVIFP